VELYGGANSAINKVAADATAFFHRTSTFNIQFYASSSNLSSPFPDSGFSLVDGESRVKVVLVQRRIYKTIGMVESIVSNSPHDWPYG